MGSAAPPILNYLALLRFAGQNDKHDQP